MLDLRAPIDPADAIKEVNFLVYLYEPSTQYRSLQAFATYAREAKNKAKQQVDDACKTEGWIYRRLGRNFIPVGYAYLTGDGGTDYKELVSEHVDYIAEPIMGDGDVLVPGWYFADETEAYRGPFETMEAAHNALREYADTL